MKTRLLGYGNKKDVISILKEIDTTLEKFPTKGLETMIAFAIHKSSKDMIVRNEGRNFYSIHLEVK
jgi:hypothetical protein